MKEILILSPFDPVSNMPTKILDCELNKIKTFSAGYKFYFDKVFYKSFHKAIKFIFEQPDCFLVLGELTEYGEELYEDEKPGPRRKKKGKPTIQDREGSEVVLDIDDHIIFGYDALNPVPAIKKWLRERKIDCDVTWQITASQKLDTEEARIRLYFELDKPASLELRKAYAQSEEIGADGSVFTCSQPIYTAPPVIQDGEDPITQRHGFIKGRRRKFTLPKIDLKKAKRETNLFLREGVDYDFESQELPQEVKEGRIYRRYFMPLAFHLANKGYTPDEIFEIIADLSTQVESREFDPDNVREYIGDAFWKINEEKKLDNRKALTPEECEKDLEVDKALPVFPKDLLDSWPEPWPMVWRNFKRIPRETVEELLVPTILSIHGYLLQANYVTENGRRPNMMFLCLCPSTGKKDVNSKDVVDTLDEIFIRRGARLSPFSNIMVGESTITADISFLQSFDENENLFWVNTEATRIFHQLKQSGGNSNVAALSDKFIEVVDGKEIRGKRKVKESGKVIKDPNCQILFYAQPETIEQYITEETVDSGLFGRTLLSIVPELTFDRDSFSMFLLPGSSDKDIEDAFYQLYMSEDMTPAKSKTKKIARILESEKVKLHEWSSDYIFDLIEEDGTFYKVLTRIANSAEQLYCIILGTCQAYDSYMGKEIRQSIPVDCMIPLLEYWVDTKVYAIKNYVSRSLDPYEEEVRKILKECVAGKHRKVFKSKEAREVLHRENLVPKNYIWRIARNRSAFRRRIKEYGERFAMRYLYSTIDLMIKHGDLIESQGGYVGLPQEG